MQSNIITHVSSVSRYIVHVILFFKILQTPVACDQMWIDRLSLKYFCCEVTIRSKRLLSFVGKFATVNTHAGYSCFKKNVVGKCFWWWFYQLMIKATCNCRLFFPYSERLATSNVPPTAIYTFTRFTEKENLGTELRRSGGQFALRLRFIVLVFTSPCGGDLRLEHNAVCGRFLP